MKQKLINLKTTLLCLLLLLVGVNASWAEDATMAGGTNGSSATVNDKDAIKVGTSNKGGTMTITVPAGATSLELYAAAWNGVSGLSLNITPTANVSTTSIALTADAGISGSSPFTLSGDEADYKFTIPLNNITSQTTLTFTSSTAKRFVVWGATYSSAPAAQAAPTITTQPTAATYDQGATATALTVAASGNPTPTYQWYSNTTASNENGTAISGATSASYTPSTANAGTTYYYCVATNTLGSAKSNPTAITVNAVTLYTVTFDAGSGSCTTPSATQTSKGASVTLPTPTIDAEGWTFYGWSTSKQTTETTTAPTKLSGTTYTPTDNVTLYAVYTATESDGNTTVTGSNLSGTTTATKLDSNHPITYKISAKNSYSNPLRLYSNNTLTIAGANMTRIECTVASNYDASKLVLSNNAVGSITNGVWTYDNGATSVTIKADGEQVRISSIKVTYASTTTKYSSVVVVKTLQSIAVSGTPTKTTYEAGENFDPTGLIVTGTYDDNSTSTITSGITWSEPSALTAGQTSVDITATVKGITSPEYTVTGLTVVHIENTTVVFNCAEGTGTSTSPVEFTIGEENTFPTAVVKGENGDAIEGAAITYSTTNSAYITVDATTGALELKKYAAPSSGVKVTATYDGDATHKGGTATYYLTIAKGTPVITFADATLYASLDETDAGLDASVTKGGDLTIKYSSSDTEVASFANENSHILTLYKPGTATITAKSVANDAWNQSNEVSYTLIVTDPAHDSRYVLVENQADFTDGEYVIAIRNAVDGTYKAMTTTFTENCLKAVNVNVADKTISRLNGAAVWTVTTESKAGDNGTIYLASFKNGSDYLCSDNAGINLANAAVNFPTIVTAAGTLIYDDEYYSNSLAYDSELGFNFFSLGSNKSNLISLFKRVSHNVTFSVNDVAGEPVAVYEGEDITFPANPEDINGKKFMGWATATIEGTQDTAPEFVTDAIMGTEDVTYYAVFASQSGNEDGSVDFTVKTIDELAMSNGSRTQTTNGITFTFSFVGQPSGTQTVQMGKGCTLTQSAPFTGPIKKISFEDFSYSSTSNASMVVSGKNGVDGNYTEVQSCASTYTGADIDFSGNDYNMFKIEVGSDRTVKFTKMTVTYSAVTYSDYCTTVAPEFVSVTISENCYDTDAEEVKTYYATFSTSKAFKVPTDVTVSEVGIANNKLNVQSYAEGASVPANTGVMVSSSTPGIKYFEVTTGGTSVLGSSNALRPSGDEGITSTAMADNDANCTFYRLTMHNGTQIGFWYGAPDGAAFALGANKAYLAVLNDTQVKASFWIGNNDATVINSVSSTLNENAPVYNLSGQRVSHTTKGIVIQNGKKFVNK